MSGILNSSTDKGNNDINKQLMKQSTVFQNQNLDFRVN